MSYCDVESVKSVKAVSRLLSPEGSWTDADIAAKIDEIGSAVIDARLTGVYEVPFAETPDAVERICRLKTAYEMLVEEYGANGGKYDFLNVEAEYLLQGIETRKINLAAPEAADYGEGEAKLFVGDDTRYFGMDGGGL